MTTTPEGRRELKTCPFCGSTRVTIWNAGGGQQAVCKDCRATGPVCTTWGQALSIWNTRAEEGRLLASLEEAEGREKARVDKVEKIGCRAAELTFDWLCGEFEDLPNKLAEDMSVQITDNIIWALGEGSAIDDFADAEQQVLELRARAEASEQRADELTKAFDLLVSSVLAARTTNTRAYMEGLADDLNVALAAFGDPDRVAFERGSFSVTRVTTKSGEA